MNKNANNSDGFPFSIEPIEAIDIEEVMKERKKANERVQKLEEGKLNDVKCPVCKSTNKKHVVHRENNGVLGSGYASWITDDYFVCQDCGVMFKNIK